MIFINDEPLPCTLFPDNTSQVWNLSSKVLSARFALIKWKFDCESEVMHLYQLKDLLDSFKIKAYLTISYLPYARQDKEITNETTFALRTFAKILNQMKFSIVTIEDPHSDLALKLIKNSVAIYPELRLRQILDKTKSNMICYPDKGAFTKYSKQYSELMLPNIITGNKIRNQKTGKITSYQLSGDPIGKDVLIVDDICDGGATFIELSKILIKSGARNVDLFVTHGIFSNGLSGLFNAGIRRIFDKDRELTRRTLDIQL